MSDDWPEDDADQWEDGNNGDWDEFPEEEEQEEEQPKAKKNNEKREEDWKIDVENLFYTAESEMKEDADSALQQFLECIRLEEEKLKVVFKRFQALKHVVILQYGKSQKGVKNAKNEMIATYKKLLSYADAVYANDLNAAIRQILDTVQQSQDAEALTQMYSMTLDCFKSKSGKEHVWFDFAMRLCKTYLEVKQYDKCKALLDELHTSCKTVAGEDDLTKGADLLQIYALQIQIMAAQKNRMGLNELFEKTARLGADVHDDRSMSVIKECWGKHFASMNQWNEAYANFFDAFRAYSQIGHTNVRQCLKYVVVACMLAENTTNPFVTPEAGVYQSHSDIIPIASLLQSFENDDINQFEAILNRDKSSILNDEFIKEYMPSVQLRLRSRVLVKLIKPYKRVKLDWLCKQLNAKPNEIENLVVNLILDGTINGRLDQIQALLDLNFVTQTDKLYKEMIEWTKALNRLQSTIANKSQNLDSGRHPLGMGHGMNLGYDFDVDDDFMTFGGDEMDALM